MTPLTREHVEKLRFRAQEALQDCGPDAQVSLCTTEESLKLCEDWLKMREALEKIIVVDGCEFLYPRGPEIARQALGRDGG